MNTFTNKEIACAIAHGAIAAALRQCKSSFVAPDYKETAAHLRSVHAAEVDKLQEHGDYRVRVEARELQARLPSEHQPEEFLQSINIRYM